MPATTSPTQLKSHQAYQEIRAWIRDGRYHPGQRLPSERDLAQTLGLNHLTVRRGLSRLVEEGLIEKRPNVGNFVAESTGVTPLALVLPEYLHGVSGGHPWTGLLTAGVCSALDVMRYSLSTVFYASNQLWEDTGRALVNAQVQGVLLVPDSSVTLAQVRKLLDHKLQVVLLRDVPLLAPLGLCTVQPDHEMALMQMLYGLAERGHRRIKVAAYVWDPQRDAMLSALRVVLEQTQLGTLEQVLLDLENAANTSAKDCYQAIHTLLEQDERPTAIIVPDEFAAAELYQACYRLGIRVPQDLSVAAVVDHTPHAYPVSMSAPDSPEVARIAGCVAAEQLVRLVLGEPTPDRRIRLRNEMTWRDSVQSIAAQPVGDC